MPLDAKTDPRLAALTAAHPHRNPRLFQAPGRVNLLGEHTDYSGGFCMPAALTFNTLVAATPRADRILTLNSLDFQEQAEVNLDHLPEHSQGWQAYCLGVAWALQGKGIALRGADLTLSGNVPLGSGLSSSASVEVATATALLALANQTIPIPQVALACQKAENDYVGAPSGIMDQFISAAGVAGNALALDTRALTFTLAPIPTHLRLVISNSMVRHNNNDGKYALRRKEVEEAAAALHRANPAIHQLRDATLEDLNVQRASMSPEAFLRARHVITDSQRVLDGVQALQTGNPTRFGQLMTAAHASFRDDFQASCPHCDLLVAEALKLPGCLGSRLTGGGFGGCTVSLVEAAQAETFVANLRASYQQATGTQADLYITEAAAGAGEL